MKKVFKTDSYTCYRSIWLMLGWMTFSLLILTCLQREVASRFFDEKARWLVILFISACAALWSHHKFMYIGVDNGVLVLRRAFRTIRIPIEQVNGLSYRSAREYRLIIKYTNQGSRRERSEEHTSELQSRQYL